MACQAKDAAQTSCNSVIETIAPSNDNESLKTQFSYISSQRGCLEKSHGMTLALESQLRPIYI